MNFNLVFMISARADRKAKEFCTVS